jgi:hypothetical protein
MGRKKIRPNEEEEKKQYAKDHYYENIKKYMTKKREEIKIQKLMKLYYTIKSCNNFDDIKETLFKQIRLTKNFT